MGKKGKINVGQNHREYLYIVTGIASSEKLDHGLYHYQGLKMFMKALTEGYFFIVRGLPLKFSLQKRKTKPLFLEITVFVSLL